MSKLLSFIKARTALIGSTLLQLLLFYFAFAITRLDMSIYFMMAEIVLFLLFIYLVISYFQHKRSLNLARENEELKAELEKLRMREISERKSVQEYFLMWLHQIKTPITASKLILEDDTEPVADELKAQLIYIEEYTNMAMSYLKLMNVETDFSVTEVSLDEVIRLVLKKYSIIFIKNSLSLDYQSLGISVYSDTRWLTILLEQLISNALKYTENGSISIYYDGERSALCVKDTGMGIRSEDLPKIFDKGYSGFNGRLNQKSSGIGLFLASRIAKRLDLRITVESKPREGSLFAIENLKIAPHALLNLQNCKFHGQACKLI